MEVSKAKEFIILEDYYDNPSFIVSKDLDKILEITNNSLVGVFGIIDTEDGEVLMEMDWSYAGEPILMRRFLHKKFFYKRIYYNRNKIFIIMKEIFKISS